MLGAPHKVNTTNGQRQRGKQGFKVAEKEERQKGTGNKSVWEVDNHRGKEQERTKQDKTQEKDHKINKYKLTLKI